MNNLKDVIKEIVEASGNHLYDVEWTSENKMKILRVSILDDEGKMDIDTCASVSQLISAKLDELDNITNEYYLEVCSPGAERVLRDEEEVKAAVNDYVYIKFKNPKDGLDEVKGYLLEINDDNYVVEYLAKNIKKKLNVEKANVGLIRLSVKI